MLDFNKKLKAWYLENHRKLLWRQTKDPYRIWLSEIILQQTRVAQGTPYYEKFVDNFPTVRDLAAADERDVLRLWQGLGYYSRARNMHHTARLIVSEYNGVFPNNAADLERLKGLGAYTAAAIASFAYDERVPAIDGNVYRVMARLFGIDVDMLSGKGKKEFAKIASQIISQDDPATYNQAMIEFGALQCVPVSPNCKACVFQDICYANLHHMQSSLPVKVKKLKIKNRFLNYFVIEHEGQLIFRERKGRDIWHGLYDFPYVESDSPGKFPDEKDLTPDLQVVLDHGVLREVEKTYFHILTHQRLSVKFWWVTFNILPANFPRDNFQFYSPSEVDNLPKPILIDNLLRDEGYLHTVPLL